MVENVFNAQHLGVILLHNLKWDKQIESICTKANKRLDIINSVRRKKMAALEIEAKTCHQRYGHDVILTFTHVTMTFCL